MKRISTALQGLPTFVKIALTLLIGYIVLQYHGAFIALSIAIICTLVVTAGLWQIIKWLMAN